jgi:hypothetical protein
MDLTRYDVMKKQENRARTTCPICGKRFVKKVEWQKFCSDRCRLENFFRKKYGGEEK